MRIRNFWRQEQIKQHEASELSRVALDVALMEHEKAVHQIKVAAAASALQVSSDAASPRRQPVPPASGGGGGGTGSGGSVANAVAAAAAAVSQAEVAAASLASAGTRRNAGRHQEDAKNYAPVFHSIATMRRPAPAPAMGGTLLADSSELADPERTFAVYGAAAALDAADSGAAGEHGGEIGAWLERVVVGYSRFAPAFRAASDVCCFSHACPVGVGGSVMFIVGSR